MRGASTKPGENALRQSLAGFFNIRLVISVVVVLLSIPLITAAEGWFGDLWLTPDQQAQRLFQQGYFEEAAQLFTDPLRQGVAYYRAGNFKYAAGVFGRSSSPTAHFNRGNALLLSGKYEEAIASYGEALKQQPDWVAAQENQQIAQARKAKLEPKGGTRGTQLEPDDIVVDHTKKDSPGESQEHVEEAEGPSDKELRTLWLRRVQTKPADFLRAKFAYQLAHRNHGEDFQ